MAMKNENSEGAVESNKARLIFAAIAVILYVMSALTDGSYPIVSTAFFCLTIAVVPFAIIYEYVGRVNNHVERENKIDERKLGVPLGGAIIAMLFVSMITRHDYPVFSEIFSWGVPLLAIVGGAFIIHVRNQRNRRG
jgi:uncharacterized membrane protein